MKFLERGAGVHLATVVASERHWLDYILSIVGVLGIRIIVRIRNRWKRYSTDTQKW